MEPEGVCINGKHVSFEKALRYYHRKGYKNITIEGMKKMLEVLRMRNALK